MLGRCRSLQPDLTLNNHLINTYNKGKAINSMRLECELIANGLLDNE